MSEVVNDEQGIRAVIMQAMRGDPSGDSAVRYVMSCIRAAHAEGMLQGIRQVRDIFDKEPAE